jgi:integrase
MVVGEREISAFLTHLATVNKVSASTQNQALHALLFLYRIVLGQPMGAGMQFPRAKRPQRLPVVLSPREVREVIGQMTAVPRLCATLMYGSGLRVSECIALRVKDVDFDRMEILVRAGKGNKDRRAPLPVTAVPELRRHLERVRRQFHRDLAAGLRGAALPEALGRKIPGANRDWAWQWVFPAARAYVEVATAVRRRHHLHETVLQRAMTSAVRSSGISK